MLHNNFGAEDHNPSAIEDVIDTYQSVGALAYELCLKSILLGSGMDEGLVMIYWNFNVDTESRLDLSLDSCRSCYRNCIYLTGSAPLARLPA